MPVVEVPSDCSGDSAERRRYLLGGMRRSAETPLRGYEIFGLVAGTH